MARSDLAKSADSKGKNGPLPMPRDGPMGDVDGALAAVGDRTSRCDEAARWRKGTLDGPDLDVA